MTTNQFNYAQLSETRRANRMREIETSVHNRNTEGETMRHDVATEALDYGRLVETQRHDMATESTDRFKAYEQQRHDYATEDISERNLYETAAHNRATEATAAYSAETGRMDVLEKARHNRTAESIDYGRLSETTRHDKATEEAGYISARAAQTKSEAYANDSHTKWAEHLLNRDRLEMDENYVGLKNRELDLKERQYKSATTQADREFQRDNRRYLTSQVQKYLDKLSVDSGDIENVIKKGSGLIWTAGF